MKQLNDSDIANMIGEDFRPCDVETQKQVRKSLHLSTRIPQPEYPTPTHITIDFHDHTEQEAWEMLVQVATSGVRSATVITGASGVLKQKFPQWMQESILTPHILSFEPLNNGSFAVKFHRKSKTV
jgi:DNA-nicking Smr family endonuclease